MKKDQLSFCDVEQLLSELARHDLQAAAQEDAQTELMRGAARREIRRVFFRRRCLRAAGHMAALAGLGTSFYLLQPELGTNKPLATLESEYDAATTGMGEAAPAPAPSAATSLATAPALRPKKSISQPACGFDCGSEPCEVVIYSVPL